MKITKRLIPAFLLSTTFLFASNYEGCGVNEKEARQNLANNISTKVESTSLLKKKNYSFLGIESYEKSFSLVSKQTTKLNLQDLNIYDKGDLVCASISNKALYMHTQNLVSKSLSYTDFDLPQYEKEKVPKINSILSEINSAISLSDLYANRFSKKTKDSLKRKLTYFTNLRNRYNTQFVKVNVIGDYDSLKIDGKKIAENSEIFLKAGKHKLEVESYMHCPIQKEFILEKNSDLESTIKMDKHKLPSLLISSDKSAKFIVNGKTRRLGKKIYFNRCDDSTISYSVKFDNEVKNGTFQLSANNSYEKEYNFYSRAEKRDFTILSNSFDDGKRLEIKYSKLKPKDSNLQEMHSINVNHLENSDWLRKGFGFLYAQGEDSKGIEFLYNYSVQVNKLLRNEPLRVGSVVFVPNFGVQLGVGYHDVYNKKRKQNIDTFKGSNIINDYGVAKANAGVDFVINQSMSANIFINKSFTMEESSSIGAGISLKLK